MPFQADEYCIGMIAYFTINDLRRHPRIRNTATSRDTKPRPFVCYAEADGELYWTALTGTPHRDRRAVDSKWLRLPAGRFLGGDQIIIGDGSTNFVGPADAFAELSRKHDRFKGFHRPILLREGVEQVHMIVAGRGGLMPSMQRCAA